LESLISFLSRKLFEPVLIMSGRGALRIVSFGYLDGGSGTWIWRRQGHRIQFGWFLTMFAAFGVWTVAFWLFATVLDRLASG